MSDGLEEVTKGSLGALFDQIRQMWTNHLLRKRLKTMLRDKRFPNGFRSFSQLQNGIGKDKKTTIELLIAIRARKSENSDEWTLNPPKGTKII